jgi:hypothetical protein
MEALHNGLPPPAAVEAAEAVHDSIRGAGLVDRYHGPQVQYTCCMADLRGIPLAAKADLMWRSTS